MSYRTRFANAVALNDTNNFAHPLTTVGFGDVTPDSEIVRLLTIMMILIGSVLILPQVGDSIKQLVKNANQATNDYNSKLNTDDEDTKFCKVCGKRLLEDGN